jgi:hypothetical protein
MYHLLTWPPNLLVALLTSAGAVCVTSILTFCLEISAELRLALCVREDTRQSVLPLSRLGRNLGALNSFY